MWNIVANVVVPDTAGLPVNAATAAVLLAVARRSGVSWDHLGLRRDSVGKGLRVGGTVAVTVVSAIVLAAIVPASREFLADDRFIGVNAMEAVYETLVRIPIATSLAEEIAFRSVLLGMLLLWMSPLRATAISSVLFGLWHVLPAFEALETTPATDLVSAPATTVAAVVGQVIATGLVGAGFAWFRSRGGSIVAPILIHWGTNGAAYAAGWLIVWNAWT